MSHMRHELEDTGYMIGMLVSVRYDQLSGIAYCIMFITETKPLE